ncbi:MFS transporter [Aquihabitans sp. G128]|uniref:MFS transporter n=1 Tax=Aquihabitans sp. G128 TaxID=2849779 RepID=UPI001C22A141|nr:MFS transporter [Aquihabitans sp. G128]QXC59402.1 MFS transporter [Aquihabitans sp. G128]
MSLIERARTQPPPDPVPGAPAEAAGLEPHEQLSVRQRNLVLAAMCLALVLVVASVSMLAVGLPSVSEALGLTQTTQTWVVDAYALTLASLLLVAGALGDRFGRRGALLVGIAILAIGSVLSTLADTGAQLIAFRALTGIGGALIMPGTLSTITSVFPPEERPRAVGIWAGFAGAGGTLGMLGAGWLLGTWSWHSLFYVTAAVAAVTFAAVLAFVPTTKATEHVGLDPLGTVLSALGIGGVVLGIIEGPIRGWSHPITVTGLVAGVLLLAAFVAWELRTDHPLLDPRLFRHRGFATGSAALMVLFIALFGIFLVILQYLQVMLGYSALKSAVALLPMTFVMIPVSAIAAPLSVKMGQKLVGGGGLVISAIGLLAFSTVNPDSGYLPLLVAQLVLAAGVGLSMTPATNAIVSSLPTSKQGVASAVNDTTREIGTALGIAIMGSMFNSGYRRAIDGDLQGLPTGVAGQAREAPGLALDAAKGLGPRGDALASAARDAFTSGMRLSMFVGATLLVLAAAFVVLRGPSQGEAVAEDVLDDELVDDGLVLAVEA